MSNQRLKQFGEKGVHNKIDWIREADSKLISAKILREVASVKETELKRLCESGKANSQSVFELIQPVESANKSSFLLLGYAIELLLKSGVVSLLINAPKHLLELKVRKYGHKLQNMCTDLNIDLIGTEKELLEVLSSFIVNEARYPVTVSSIQEYSKLKNEIGAQLANNESFNLGVHIYDNVRKILSGIDGTEDNPVFRGRREIDSDGYYVFRVGGTLPPVLIFKYSEKKIKGGKNNVDDMKSLIVNSLDNDIISRILLDSLDLSDIYIASEKSGLVKYQH
ncbi:hypothetical protein [Agarivorans sp. Alg241-V36]|uniref:hypothetical protein n=1 Tax=Agarivorans sp. Alg241-V36 TaxID=2305992 RepID=UPI0013D2D934|nr:hypothetical protein [Agarivorans sp. Alg241-V36]